MNISDLWESCGRSTKRPAAGWWGEGRSDLLKAFSVSSGMPAVHAAHAFGKYVAERRKEIANA